MRPWFILAAIVLGRVGFGLQFQTVASMGPDLVPLFHLSYAALGSLIGAYMALGIFAALPVGLLGRRFGDRPVIGAGLALMVAGALIDATATTPAGIAIGRSISGVGAVAMIVLQGKIIADWFTERLFLISISISIGAFPVGVGLAQLVVPPVTHSFGWQVAFLTNAVCPALALAVFLTSYRQPPYVAAQPRGFSLPSRWECLLLAIAGLTWTAYASSYSGYMAYVPSALANRGDSPEMIDLVALVATWGNVPAMMWSGSLSARFGGLRIFLIGATALTVGMAGTALGSGALGWAFVVGVLGTIHTGVIMAVGTLSARAENRAVGMGLFYTLYFIGGSVSPTFCGWVADRMGRPDGGVLAAAAISAMTVPLFLLHRKLARHETMLVRA